MKILVPLLCGFLRTVPLLIQTYSNMFSSPTGHYQGLLKLLGVITIDCSHLYDKYKYKMLVVVGVDANLQLFPLAFAIVEGKSNGN